MPYDAAAYVEVDAATPREDEVLILLTEARGLLARGWCRLAFAQRHRRVLFFFRDVTDVEPEDTSATHFCGIGALRHAVRHSLRSNPMSPAYAQAEAALGGYGTIMKVNDDLGKAAVLKLFDDAITARSSVA